jgi:hypothetical protein
MYKKHRGQITGKAVNYTIPKPAGGVQMETFIPWKLVKRGVRRQIITPFDTADAFHEEARVEQQKQKESQDSPLLRALGLAHHWQKLLDDGQYRTMTEIAAAEGIDLGQASRMARLTQLAPHLVEVYLTEQGSDLSLEHFIRRGLPVDWHDQAKKFRSVTNEDVNQ